jgi:hypothetical protein
MRDDGENNFFFVFMRKLLRRIMSLSILQEISKYTVCTMNESVTFNTPLKYM